jgi:hypothetical protein
VLIDMTPACKTAEKGVWSAENLRRRSVCEGRIKPHYASQGLAIENLPDVSIDTQQRKHSQSLSRMQRN